MTTWATPVLAGSFVLPKRGSSVRECEDSVGIDRRRMRFCLADGATEAFDSRRWARLLTSRWLRGQNPVVSPEGFAEWLPSVARQFDAHWQDRPLPWYAEEKRRSGAFAAFASLAFTRSGPDLSWSAAVLGDTCLFRRNNGALTEVLGELPGPACDRRPTLLPSNRASQPGTLNRVAFKCGLAAPGEVFVLLTDAIAAWYFRTQENDPPLAARFETLLAGSGRVELSDLVQSERDRGVLRNDDVAGIRVEVCATNPDSEANG